MYIFPIENPITSWRYVYPAPVQRVHFVGLHSITVRFAYIENGVDVIPASYVGLPEVFWYLTFLISCVSWGDFYNFQEVLTYPTPRRWKKWIKGVGVGGCQRIWSNYSDLTRPRPKRYIFSFGQKGSIGFGLVLSKGISHPTPGWISLWDFFRRNPPQKKKQGRFWSGDLSTFFRG